MKTKVLQWTVGIILFGSISVYAIRRHDAEDKRWLDDLQTSITDSSNRAHEKVLVDDFVRRFRKTAEAELPKLKDEGERLLSRLKDEGSKLRLKECLGETRKP